MSGMLCQMSVHCSQGSYNALEEPLIKKRKIEADHHVSMHAQPPALPELNKAPHLDDSLEPRPVSDADLFLKEISSSDFMPSMDKCTSEDFVSSMLDNAIEEPLTKKRKIEADDVGSMHAQPPASSELNEAPHLDDPLVPNPVSDADLFLKEIPSSDFLPTMDKCTSEYIEPAAVNSSSIVNRSVSTSEGSSVTHDEKTHEELDPALSQKLNDAISTLPKPLQNIFVERIVENITNPDAYKKHMEAVSALATAAAIEAQSASSGEGEDMISTENHLDTTLPVAAAALGAYLATYGEATRKENPASAAAA